MKKVIISILTLLLVVACGLRAPAAPVPDSELHAASDPDSKLRTVSFKNSTTITLPTTTAYPHLTSIAMVFPGGAQTITWKINIIRDGNTIELVDYSGTGTTFTYFFPGVLHLQSHDQIYIETGVAATAVAYLSENY